MWPIFGVCPEGVHTYLCTMSIRLSVGIEINEIKGVDGAVVSYPERMVVRWEGLRVGKDTPCRVPLLLENVF